MCHAACGTKSPGFLWEVQPSKGTGDEVRALLLLEWSKPSLQQVKLLFQSQVFPSLLDLSPRVVLVAAGHIHGTLTLVKLHIAAADNSCGSVYCKTRPASWSCILCTKTITILFALKINCWHRIIPVKAFFIFLNFLRLKMHFTPQYRVAVLTEILKIQNVNLALLLPYIILPTNVVGFFSVSSVGHFSSNVMLLPSLS